MVDVGHRPGEGVGVIQRPVADGQDDLVAAGAGGTQRARHHAGAKLMLIPSGRLVAEYVRVSAALASDASASKLMTAPSSSERSVNSVLKTGATLGSMTVQVKESVSVRVPSLTVRTTA